MSSLKNNIYIKIGIILVLVFLLLIPAAMIRSLVLERESRQYEAIEEVSSKWAREQTITGPALMIPYLKEIRKDSSSKPIEVVQYLYILPAKLKVDGNIQPEQRNRGIFQIVVYNSNTKLSGNFDLGEIKNLGISKNKVQFDKAKFIVGINDLRGLEKQIELNWNGNKILFDPGVPNYQLVESGINAGINIDTTQSEMVDFNFELALKGSQKLYFTPVGKETDVNLQSSWTNPSFEGSFLPDSREVTESGFSANWNILHLNRNYPQVFTENADISSSAFGLDLLLPVDNYQKSYRSVTYALLFIVFTFLVFFFIEIMNKVFIHPIQYLLVGVALVIFYSLLLSISEYLPFNLSFLISMVLTIGLIAGYTKTILKSNRLTGLLVGILTILYVFNFVIIQMQDYSLLIGSIGIFLILAIVMYTSRKIDWYNIQTNRD
jgi:inner membrane protein